VVVKKNFRVFFLGSGLHISQKSFHFSELCRGVFVLINSLYCHWYGGVTDSEANANLLYRGRSVLSGETDRYFPAGQPAVWRPEFLGANSEMIGDEADY
jgi:hypothetical protein